MEPTQLYYKGFVLLLILVIHKITFSVIDTKNVQ